MKIFLKFVYVLLLSFILLGAPRIGGWFANLFDYQWIDPDGAFMWISIHHIVQAVVIMVIMFVFIKLFKVDFHLGVGNKEIGIKYLKRFALVFFVYTIVAFTITILSGAFESFMYPLTARNIVGYLGFQMFLSGPSEEFVFRAFAITIFLFLVTEKRLNKHLSYAVLFASIIFGIAHIQFSFHPFNLSFSTFQVVYAMVLGYFYGDCYEKSKSVLYPIIMHSFTNVLMMGLTIILSFFI